MINIRAYGAPQYIKKLERLGRGIEELEKPMREMGKIALAAVKSYPSYGDWRHGQVSSDLQRPGSKYRRTLNLQKSITGRLYNANKSNARYMVYQGNRARADYLKYVIGDEQDPYHAGYWQTMEEWKPLIQEAVLDVFHKWYRNLA